MPKPSDFFMGLADFFAILLPGAVLGYLVLLIGWADGVRAVVMRPLADPAAQWAAFLVMAYVFGHLLHHLGGFLDKPVYDDRFRTWRREKLGWMLDPREWAEFRKKTGEGTPSLMEQRATALAARHWDLLAGRFGQAALGHKPDDEKLYGWAEAAVRRADPAVGAELDRAAVDSKFFRSMAGVAAAAAVIVPWKLALEVGWPWALAWVPASFLAAVAFGLFSLYRFGDRRWAASEQTYRHFVLLALAGEDLLPSPPTDPPGSAANPFTVRLMAGGPAPARGGPPGPTPAEAVAAHLRAHCGGTGIGVVCLPGTEFRCFPADPTRVRVPDAAVLHEDPTTYIHPAGPVADVPVLAVLVAAPGQLAYDLAEKVADFQAAGTPLIWVIDPPRRQATVYRADGTIVRVAEPADLSGEAVLPGLVVPLSAVLPAVRPTAL